jgi:hypothetical protein
LRLREGDAAFSAVRGRNLRERAADNSGRRIFTVAGLVDAAVDLKYRLGNIETDHRDRSLNKRSHPLALTCG